VPLNDEKLAKAVNTTEKLVKRMDALEARRKDDYGHPVKMNNRVQQSDYGVEPENKLSLDARRGQED
jgi:hypothetical protein